MYLIGLANTGNQTVQTEGVINIGDVYRRYCRRNSCGTRVFDVNGTGVTLNWSGIYHITATFVVSASNAGDITIQAFENGAPVPLAIATTTITTPDTEFATVVIDYYTILNEAVVLGVDSTTSKSITFENVGDEANFTNVVVNVTKEA